MIRRAVLGLLFATGAAHAHSYKAGKIVIGHAWALPTQQTDAQVFFPLLNTGKSTDRLLTARSDIAAVAELRRNNRYDDPAEITFELAPGKPFPMRPTAFHIRLIGLRKPLVVGDLFSVILDFETAGEVEIQVQAAETPGE
jgi:periplasmic copper chaperone A